MDIYDKRQNKPVMISFAKKLTSTFEIPFPAITICQESLSENAERILLKFQENRTLDIDELLSLELINQVYDLNLKLNALNMTSGANNFPNELEKIAMPLDKIFDTCRYGSFRFSDCKKYFTKIITDVGVCYTFNMLDYRDLFNADHLDESLKSPDHGKKADWFLEKEYRSLKLETYPRRVLGSGLMAGLSIQLKNNNFRLAIHTPAEIPQISKQFISIQGQKQTTIALRPQMIYASKDLNGYNPNKRQCYLPGERNLKFFKVYSKSSCELECLADVSYRECGCIKFSMPHGNETNICDNSKLECLHDAEMKYILLDLKIKLFEKQLAKDKKAGKSLKTDAKTLEIPKSCNCLPSCASLQFDAEISQTNTKSDVTQINIYFKEAFFSRLKRYEMYGWSEFLSNCGGTLGLFLGCSICSIIEIIYHLVLYFLHKCCRDEKTFKVDSN